MEEMLAQLEHLLAQVVGNPDQKISAFDLVTPNAKHVLPDAKQAFARREFKSITRHFSDQAERRPQAIAVSDSRANVTYADLDARTNQLANYLLASGIEKGDVVAIYAHRSANLVAAILGVLKAGAAFTILDPAYPAARMIDCLKIASPHAFIQIEAAGPLPELLAEFVDSLDSYSRAQLSMDSASDSFAHCSPSNPNVTIEADDLAYIAFTSGSTGLPKGVMGRQGPLTLFTSWAIDTFGLNESD